MLALAGCGESDEDQIKTQVDTLYAAVADGDGEAACEVVTEEAKKQSEESEDKSCAQAIEDGAKELNDDQRERLANIEISEVKVDGDSATVTVKSGDDEEQLNLKKEDDEWKLSDLNAG